MDISEFEAFLLHPQSKSGRLAPPSGIPEELLELAEDIKSALWEDITIKFPSSLKVEELDLSGFSGENPLLLLAGISYLLMFIQANWTGPPFKKEVTGRPDLFSRECCIGRKACQDLEVDGEPLYNKVYGSALIFSSIKILEKCSLPTSVIWRCRAAFAHQRVLQEASDRGTGYSESLMNLCVNQFAEVLRDWGLLTSDRFTLIDNSLMKRAPNQLREENTSRNNFMVGNVDILSNDTKAALLTELAVRLGYYGRLKGMSPAILQACDAQWGFNFEVTGVEGIRRKYQTKSFAQLACLTWSGRREGDLSESSAAGKMAHRNVLLEELDPDTDILERVRFSEQESGELESPLVAGEQAILLVEALRLYYDSAAEADTLQLQIINALVSRALICVKESEDWLVYSCALWLRCKTEFHRTKTRARSCFQLQALVDQYHDEGGEAESRLPWVFSLGYPSRWEIQKELARRMMEVGMLMSAFEMYSALELWGDAVDCLTVAGRKQQALDLLQEKLDLESPDPRLLCSLGELSEDPSHWERAWEVSGHRYARAQRCLGRYFLKREQWENAVTAFELAVAIAPLHRDIWFSLGCSYMKLDKANLAVGAFVRYLGIEPEDPQGWGNLAACHVSCGDLPQARICVGEAVKHASQNWKLWQSFLAISLRLKDFGGIFRALRFFGEAENMDRLDKEVLQVLTLAVINDESGIYNTTNTGRAYSRQMVSLLDFLCSRRVTEPLLWRLQSLLAQSCLPGTSLLRAVEFRVKELRCLISSIVDSRTAEELAQGIQQVVDCFEGLLDVLKKVETVEDVGALIMLVKGTLRKINVKFVENRGVLDGDRSEKCDLAVRRMDKIADEVLQLLSSTNAIVEE